MPASRIVWWKPRLLITVATTVSSVSAPRSCSARAQIGQDRVAVDDVAVRGDGQAAVGVAVVGDAEVGAVLADGVDQRAEVGRADAVVDVPAVGLAADGVHRGAGPAVDVGGDGGGGAVGAVDDERSARRAAGRRSDRRWRA